MGHLAFGDLTAWSKQRDAPERERFSVRSERLGQKNRCVLTCFEILRMFGEA
jgi:hypothetical protein